MFAPVRIADFHFAKDRLFAELNLSRDELELYEKIVDRLDIEAPEPDLVVYLQASVDVLMARVAQAGIPYEGMIRLAYLEEVSDRYGLYFRG